MQPLYLIVPGPGPGTGTGTGTPCTILYSLLTRVDDERSGKPRLNNSVTGPSCTSTRYPTYIVSGTWYAAPGNLVPGSSYQYPSLYQVPVKNGFDQSGPAAEFKSFHSQTRLQQLRQRRYVLIRWLSGFQHTTLWDCWILDSTKSAMMGLDHRHVLCLDLPSIPSTWQGITCEKRSHGIG